MKKTIVKVLAIVFVVSILVSSMFIMTGAACNSGYRMYGRSGSDSVEITYNYVNGKIEVNNITIYHDNEIYKKVWMADSNLSYVKSEQAFRKVAVSVTSAGQVASYVDDNYSNQPMDDPDLAAFAFDDPATIKIYATVRVHTGSKRAPQVGDKISVLLFTNAGPENVAVTISSISFIG